mgnify:CR=1 FL=1|tara:strand:+ start:1912 stop:2547 length:636 start_codon:yes stop_codon:yes gene_type:complete
MNIAIIDYKSGNISSVINSFKTVSEKQNSKINIEVTSNIKTIIKADKIILPGQGSFKNCMESLLKINDLKNTLDQLVIEKSKPLLGICVGMQMFADVGFEEIETKGLGWMSGHVIKINNENNKYKLPHIGWNEIKINKESKLFDGIKDQTHVYFVHSYKFVPNEKENISSKTNYSEEIVSSVEKENLFGTQFHPEKSNSNGLKLIENFIKL